MSKKRRNIDTLRVYVETIDTRVTQFFDPAVPRSPFDEPAYQVAAEVAPQFPAEGSTK